MSNCPHCHARIEREDHLCSICGAVTPPSHTEDSIISIASKPNSIEQADRAKRWGRNGFYLGLIAGPLTVVITAIGQGFSGSLFSYSMLVLILTFSFALFLTIFGVSAGTMVDGLVEWFISPSKEVDQALESAMDDDEAYRKWLTQHGGEEMPASSDEIELPPSEQTGNISSSAPAHPNAAPTDFQHGEPPLATRTPWSPESTEDRKDEQ